mgnify:CR=1 FL=1
MLSGIERRKEQVQRLDGIREKKRETRRRKREEKALQKIDLVDRVSVDSASAADVNGLSPESSQIAAK